MDGLVVVRRSAERDSKATTGQTRECVCALQCTRIKQRRTGGGRESSLHFEGPRVETLRRGLAEVRTQLLARRSILPRQRREGLVDVGEARRPDEVAERQWLLVRPAEEHGRDGRVWRND